MAAKRPAKTINQARQSARERFGIESLYRAYLLNYLGEEFAKPCGRCDNCGAGILVLPMVTSRALLRPANAVTTPGGEEK